MSFSLRSHPAQHMDHKVLNGGVRDAPCHVLSQASVRERERT